MTLTLLQIQKGQLLEPFKQRALEIIDSDEGLDRWEYDEEMLAKRKEAPAAEAAGVSLLKGSL